VDSILDVPDLKSFFRANAEFIMRCEFCVAGRADTARMMAQLREFGLAARLSRAGEKTLELSAQGLDPEDDTVYDPVVIERSAPAGRALTKWLNAARLRIGGTFPKMEAKGEMEDQKALDDTTRARR
jgi:hypothetical protein